MPKRKYQRYRQKKYIRSNTLRRESSSDNYDSDESYQSDLENDNTIDIHEYDFFKQNVVAASSPVPSEDESSVEDVSSLFGDENDLCRGSSLSLTEFDERLRIIATKHRFSDKAISDVLKLIADALPYPNMCPSLHDFQKKEKEVTVSPYNVSGGLYYSLSVQEQMQKILSRSITFANLCRTNDNMLRDITDGNLFPIVQEKTIYLIMNTDGFSAVNSKTLSFLFCPLLASPVFYYQSVSY